MITALCTRLQFPDEATACLAEADARLSATSAATQLLSEAMHDFFEENGERYEALIRQAAEAADVPYYVACMVFLLRAAARLPEKYRMAGIDEAICWDTLRDLRCKLMECHDVYGVWGIFVIFWMRDYYLLRRFAFGRLQFERIAFPHDDYRGLVKRGDTVYNFHIPSDGPLTEESVLASFRAAYAFYRNELPDGIMPIYLHSWLIYPKTAALYGEQSNLRRFFGLFTLLGEKADEKNGDFWRIFSTDFSPEALAAAPTDTSMQRSLKQYLQAGGCMGSGMGMLLFDGEKIV